MLPLEVLLLAARCVLVFTMAYVLPPLCCRAQTAASWKELRIAMETELADRLGQQQVDMQEQLAFVQVGSGGACRNCIRNH
jgi:hypothetical protein